MEDEGQTADIPAADDSPLSTADRIVADNEAKHSPHTVDKSDEKPAGYRPVDPETATPAQIKERIDYLYRQVKDNSRVVGEYRNLAKEQSEKIEQLMSGFGTVVDHLHDKSTQDNETTVRAQMRAAFESGDTDAYLKAQEDLMEIKAKKLTTPKTPQKKTETQQMANAGQRLSGAEEIADEAVRAGELSSEDKIYVGSWQNEKDESGKYIRPWAHTADMSDPDPEYVRALAYSARVWKEVNLTPAEKLAKVDKYMGTQVRQGGQNVMGGNLNTRPNKAKVSLSPEAEKLAVRMKFGGKTAKSDADHIAAYRKQMEKVSSSRRSN